MSDASGGTGGTGGSSGIGNNAFGEREFVGRRGGEVVTLVGGSVLSTVPEAKQAAEKAHRELRFDFLDDRAVLDLLHRRHDDEEDMFRAGLVHGVPLALVGSGAAVYWGGVAQYWETSAARTVYLAIAAVVVGTQFLFFVRAALSVWGDPVRQNLRARARGYREIAHIARRGGADVPAHYPHYGPYPFAAKFRPEVADREDPEGHQIPQRPGSEGSNDH
ncbi:hypothetical protein ACOT81_18965 [Streptomyces sp. WI04-05B]|uniref:hypothetical protein n=1 Tax=Streptomyces TaxID=1883 RepID=UPI0029A60450|nr:MULTISPECIES: hypothetical protein [unclassified Streptomyces]MDX2542534.1 hypothetical protein [Streptomyces sp. WI04-05B]MDX2582447.1 hypothetical protein [Streptomyces sp. WI04-05A]MDX3747860.1 hypothetical protein [Streptomyces sp. AK08-02]